jgi:predicted phage terminase large subunit-like protein
MTFKDAKTSDFVCGQVWGRHNVNFYLLDQVCARLSFTATQAAVKNLCETWPLARIKLVEDKANGTAIMESLQGIIPGFVAVEPKGSKDERLSAVTPFMEAGNVWIPSEKECPWIGDWLDELCMFPMGAYDDQVDATSQALLRFSQNASGQGVPLGVGESPSWSF